MLRSGEYVSLIEAHLKWITPRERIFLLTTDFAWATMAPLWPLVLAPNFLLAPSAANFSTGKLITVFRNLTQYFVEFSPGV